MFRAQSIKHPIATVTVGNEGGGGVGTVFGRLFAPQKPRPNADQTPDGARRRLIEPATAIRCAKNGYLPDLTRPQTTSRAACDRSLGWWTGTGASIGWNEIGKEIKVDGVKFGGPKSGLGE
ncbi:hypothetical protein ZHAS_00005883 [Anopheles sinensis]|uniref:Uncharacterized protein n=1 Tax=Anopheles sinensis TaxID=74873 RepID=A0A084VKI5_ANOSI|nr:hypothetical protein ZHAS_00005883 [Anopheles sinensis]